MSVESSISWTELKDQDLENWAVHARPPRIATSNNVDERAPSSLQSVVAIIHEGRSGYKLQIRNRSRLFSGYHLTFSTGNYLTHIISIHVLR